MKKYLLPLAAILFLCACSSKSSRLRLDETGTPAFAKNDPRDCARNFSSRVNAQRGRDFATTVFIKNGVPQNFAVNRAVRFMASEGMEIISSDEKTGHISASRVTAKRSRSAAPPPFNVSINTIPSGLKINMAYSSSRRQPAPVEGVLDLFCATAAAVESSQ